MKKRDKTENVIDTIIIGCDHSGHNQKKELIDIIQKDYDVKIIDVGTDNNKSCHYTDYAHRGCQLMNDTSRLILMCTTGTGMNIIANKYSGIRCVHGHTIHQVGMSRKHNNTNALAMGIASSEMSDMKAMVQIFMDTDFEECNADGNLTRHAIRVNKIEDDLPNKIEHNTTTNVTIDNNTYMSTPNDKDVTHTDIFKPQKARKAMSLSNMRKRDNVYPTQVKLNDKPFQPRELPPPPPEDTTLFTKTSFFVKKEVLDSDTSETNSLKVQIDPNELENIINDKIENVQLLGTVNELDEMEHKPLTPDNDNNGPVLVMTKDVDIINDIEKERLGKKSSEHKAKRLNDINKYIPSLGKPVRDLSPPVKEPEPKREITIDIDDLDDDDEVFINEPFSERVDVSKENVKSEQQMALRTEAEYTLSVLKDLQEHEKRKESKPPKRPMPIPPSKSSLIPVKVDSVPKSSKVAFNPNIVPRKVAFNPNTVSRNVALNPNTSTKDTFSKVKKIESNSRSVKPITSINNTKSTMSNKLDYPDSIDTDNTKMATMVNYMNNCNEASKLQQAIMRQIVELRERMKLVSRDLKSEMNCVFDLSEETEDTDESL